MSEIWSVGDKVTTNLEHAWIYVGTERECLMGKLRAGTVVRVPECTNRDGSGTLLIEWESLTPVPLKKPTWWTHSDMIERAE